MTAAHRSTGTPDRGSPGVTTVDRRCVGDAYDRSASRWAAADRHVYGHLARPLLDALAGVDGPVLDVAAGSGAVGERLVDPVALDLSVGQLQRNRASARVRADAHLLPFNNGSFAVAVCAFGVNHFPDPAAALAEMARVAPVVGLSTWLRPDRSYVPKEAVLDVVARHSGTRRTPVGLLVESLGQRIGSVSAVSSLMCAAGLEPRVEEVTVVVPWPGIEAFLDYRLAMPSTAGLVADEALVREEAAAVLADLPDSELDWHARLIVGVGHGPTCSHPDGDGGHPS